MFSSRIGLPQKFMNGPDLLCQTGSFALVMAEGFLRNKLKAQQRDVVLNLFTLTK